eukprot:scaffold1335_cov102-Isochrysis_galbana.AAC.11
MGTYGGGVCGAQASGNQTRVGTSGLPSGVPRLARALSSRFEPSCPGKNMCILTTPTNMHAALTPSPRKRRPEEGEGMGKEWEGGGGVTGWQRTECVVCSAESLVAAM